MKFLAKFREFRKGMDPVDYLETEMRQNFRALDTIFSELTTIANSYLNNQTVLFANPEQGITNTTSFWSLTESLVKNGKVIDDYYYPQVSGRFFIEFSAEFQNIAVANGSMSVFAQFSNPSFIITGNALTFYSVTGGVVNTFPTRVGFFADLSPGLGIGFKGSSSTTGLNLSNFTLKITKVG